MILISINERDIVVATTGFIGTEVYECRDRLGMSHKYVY